MSILVFFTSLIFFLVFQSTSIYGGDAGDLVASAYLHGVAHPPGFPLYTMLGFFLSKLPLLTVAWRVGLLSSFAAAGTLTVLFLLIKEVTKDVKAALISVASLACTYLFWLYGIVPEVFMLHCFFVSLLIYLIYKWSTTKQDRFLSAFVVTLGLSLSHHLLTIFLFPGLLYLLVSNKKLLPKLTPSYVARKGVLLAIGLLPYLYIFTAAHTTPAISWDNATTIPNFLNLVLRRTYGTFQSGPIFAQNFLSRFIQFPYMWEFMLTDFTVVGVFLAIVGSISQYKKRRKLWNFFFLLFLFVGPVYFFYASYYIIDRFSLATFERFLLPSYIIITIWIGEGILSVVLGLQTLIKTSKQNKQFTHLFYALFLIVPVSLFFINYPKISLLKHDRTAENFAGDILKTVPKNAIVILQYDSALFDTQYLYYTQHVRPDVKLFHFYKLYQGQLTDQMKKYYPEVSVPVGKEAALMDSFFKKNMGKFPIYVNNPLPIRIKDSYWVRTGLLYRFYTKDTLPKPEEIFAENDRLWQKYSDPLQGSLGKYRNLMLSNVLDFYHDSHIEVGKMYEDAQRYDKALSHYKNAHRIIPELDESFYRIGITHAKRGECTLAEKNLLKAVSINPQKSDYYFSLSQVYKACFKDEKNAAVFEKKYQDAVRQSQTAVEKL